MVCYWPRWLAKQLMAFYKILFIKQWEDRLEKAQAVTDNLSKAMMNMKTSIKTSIMGKYLG